MNRKQFLFLAASVTVLALLVREYYVLVSQVRHPYSGDPREYIAYAEHLLQGWFGKGAAPDAYRTPGYPVFVMLTMLWEGDWYPRLLQAQAILGTLTVVGVMALARHWLSRGWALLAGLLLALWPHHIQASAEIWSEVLFGFTLIGALWLSVLALERRTLPWAIAAGVAFGVAFLVNPLIALFPFVVAALFWRAGLAKQGAVIVLVSWLAVCGWGIRSASIGDSGGQRAYMNLVQGSYPLYHNAWNFRKKEPLAARVIDAMNAEIKTLLDDKPAGFRAMGERMGREPLVFVRWYLSKPMLLFDKQIRVGEHEVFMSPLVRNPILRATSAIIRAAHPWLFALSLAFALWAAWRGPPAARVVAFLFLYVTGVHTVLQAEPRYAIAYRGLEVLMVAGGLAWLASRLRRTSPVAAESGQLQPDTGASPPPLSAHLSD